MTTIVVHISFSKLIYWLHQSYKKFMELWRFPFNISSQLILWLGSQVLDKWHFHKSTSLFRNCALWRSTTLFHCDLLHEICPIFPWEVIPSILKIYPTSYSYHCNDMFVCLGILLLEGKRFSLQIRCGSLWVDLATIYALLFSPFKMKFQRKIVGLLVFKVFLQLFFSQVMNCSKLSIILRTVMLLKIALFYEIYEWPMCQVPIRPCKFMYFMVQAIIWPLFSYFSRL